MHYNEHFQPLLSLSAHVIQNRCSRDWSVRAAKTAAADILHLLSATLEEGKNSRPDKLEDAWFPVCAWMDEKLDSLWRAIGKDKPLQKLHFKTNQAGTMFFDRLEALLAAGDPEQRDIVQLYLDCLELGFAGPYRNRHDACLVKEYRRRCREALSLVPPASPSTMPPLAQPPKKRSAILLWLAPVAATLALYSVYRLLLSEWYWQLPG